MRIIAVVICVCACIHRVDTTRVTLFDPSAVETSATALQGQRTLAPSLIDHDVVIVGRPSNVLSFDRDRLHMHLVQDDRSCRHGQRCMLDLRVDTPLANVRSIRAVGVADHHVIPLGLLAGTVLAGFGGGTLGYDLVEHEHIGIGPAPVMLAVGIAILAIEIHARLARDSVTIVR